MDKNTNTRFTDVFRGTIKDVKSHSINLNGRVQKLVKQIDFAIEQSDEIDPETNQPWLVNRMSFVRNVVDANLKTLSEVDLLALRGHRVEVVVYPNYWMIYSIT